MTAPLCWRESGALVRVAATLDEIAETTRGETLCLVAPYGDGRMATERAAKCVAALSFAAGRLAAAGVSSVPVQLVAHHVRGGFNTSADRTCARLPRPDGEFWAEWTARAAADCAAVVVVCLEGWQADAVVDAAAEQAARQSKRVYLLEGM